MRDTGYLEGWLPTIRRGFTHAIGSSGGRSPGRGCTLGARRLMTKPGATLVVRSAVIADAPSVAAIGRVAFPAVHNDVVGPEFAAVMVEQTYSIEALTECITRCAAAIDAEFLVAEQDGDVISVTDWLSSSRLRAAATAQ